jgi:DNA-binding NtrC family response regulator
MGGSDAIRALREIDPGVVAIVSSGYYNDPVMANYREHGFSGVIAKPFELHTMLGILDEALNHGPVNR